LAAVVELGVDRPTGCQPSDRRTLPRSYPQSNPQSGHREGNGRANLDFEVAAGLEYIWICNRARFPKEKPNVVSLTGHPTGERGAARPMTVPASLQHTQPKGAPSPNGIYLGNGTSTFSKWVSGNRGAGFIKREVPIWNGTPPQYHSRFRNFGISSPSSSISTAMAGTSAGASSI
jgi:hypothetical protein